MTERERTLIRLAETCDDAGEWSRARDLLLEVIEAGDGGVAVHARLASVLDRLARVPFEFRDGTLVERDLPEGDDDGHEEVVRHLRLALGSEGVSREVQRVLARSVLVRRLVRGVLRRYWRRSGAGGQAGVRRRVLQPADRLRRTMALGAAYERLGALEEAERAYRAALAGLRTIDAIWVHNTEPAWRYRLDYVVERARPSAAPRPALLPSIAPAGPVRTSAERGWEPGGYFQAEVTAAGLRIDGFVVPGTEGEVAILLNGERVRTVAADSRHRLRPFGFIFAHRVLAEFAETSALTLVAGGRPLVSDGGHETVEVIVPGGTGRMPERLARGYAVSKKGTLTSPPDLLDERRLRYLETYARVRDDVEARLGKSLFLFYGTLLGCFRDGGFIAGDDDFDAAYLAEGTDPIAVKEELQEDALTLLAAGYDISVSIAGRLFKVRDGAGSWIDVNPVWFHRGRAWSFNSHALVRTDFEPVGTMRFLGHDVRVPHDIEAFLRDNYGTDWHVSQPDFRYYRDPADRNILRRSWLLPSELRRFARRADDITKRHPTAGRYLGIGNPAETGFDV